MSFPLLSVMVFLPAAGGIAAYLLGRVKEIYSRYTALAVSLAEVILTLTAFAVVASSGIYSFMLQEDYTWVKGFVDFHLGLDGLGAPLLIIASALTFLAAYGSSVEIQERQSSYYSLLLLGCNSPSNVLLHRNMGRSKQKVCSFKVSSIHIRR